MNTRDKIVICFKITYGRCQYPKGYIFFMVLFFCVFWDTLKYINTKNFRFSKFKTFSSLNSDSVCSSILKEIQNFFFLLILQFLQLFDIYIVSVVSPGQFIINKNSQVLSVLFFSKITPLSFKFAKSQVIFLLFLQQRIRFFPIFRLRTVSVSVEPTFKCFQVLDLPTLQGDKTGDFRFS